MWSDVDVNLAACYRPPTNFVLLLLRYLTKFDSRATGSPTERPIHCRSHRGTYGSQSPLLADRKFSPRVAAGTRALTLDHPQDSLHSRRWMRLGYTSTATTGKRGRSSSSNSGRRHPRGAVFVRRTRLYGVSAANRRAGRMSRSCFARGASRRSTEMTPI